MKNKLWMDRKLKEFKDDVEFLLEKAILNFTEEICEQMEKKKVSRANLAKHLGVSRAFITKMLNGQPNLTIKTMVAIAHALDSEFHTQLRPKMSKASEMPAWTWEEKEAEVPEALTRWRKKIEGPVFVRDLFSTPELQTLKAKKVRAPKGLVWRGTQRKYTSPFHYEKATMPIVEEFDASLIAA